MKNHSNQYLGGSAEHRSEKDDRGMGEGGSTEAQPGEDGWQKGNFVNGLWQSENLQVKLPTESGQVNSPMDN